VVNGLRAEGGYAFHVEQTDFLGHKETPLVKFSLAKFGKEKRDVLFILKIGFAEAKFQFFFFKILNRPLA